MTVSLASLRSRCPEWVSAPDAVAQAAIDDATSQCSSTIFGADHDLAICLLASHYLALSPYSREMRVESTGADTLYLARFKTLRNSKLCCLCRTAGDGEDPYAY